MQHMPDKDFDNLFRDKFMDAEIEPSANLWAKIEVQLEPKRKRIFPVYWMAAASMAIAFTAMLVFQKTEKIQLHTDDTLASAEKSVGQNLTPSVEETTASPVKEKIAYQDTNISSEVKKLSNLLESPVSKNNEETLQPNTTIARLLIKQAEPKPIDVLPIAPAESPIVMAQVEPQHKVEDHVIDEMDNTTERKGIRNVGDLVNYVVDKVDKRDRKLVRFNTDDDDNSSIVGINIGFLKLNKKK